jgi:multidrug transporter EmrE-like cation transporter
MSYLLVFLTVLLTVYGQMVIKWKVLEAGPLPENFQGKILFLLRLVLNPWVLSAFTAGFLAALCWMIAMTRLPLSLVYPLFIGSCFVFVLLLSSLLFNESLTWVKVASSAIIVIGMILGSRR